MTIKLSVEWDDDLEEVFSGHGLMPSVQEFLQGQVSTSSTLIDVVSQHRWLCSVTGAMRYPWSQEAPIHVTCQVTVG